MPTPVRALLVVAAGWALLVASVLVRGLPRPWRSLLGFLLAAAAMALLYLVQRPRLEREKRRRRGLCVGCGYDLTGNLTGVCPECGWRSG